MLDRLVKSQKFDGKKKFKFKARKSRGTSMRVSVYSIHQGGQLFFSIFHGKKYGNNA